MEKEIVLKAKYIKPTKILAEKDIAAWE